jgi:hypothetical protein
MEGLFSGSAPWFAVRDGDGVEERKAKTTVNPVPVAPVIDITGGWDLNANNYIAKMEITLKNKAYNGRVNFVGGIGWESITKITFDSKTKVISFYRVHGRQTYKGKVTRTRQTDKGPVAIKASGTFTGNAPWELSRR